MAYNNTPARAQQNAVFTQNVTNLEAWINNDSVKRKFNDVLDKGAGAFVTSLLSLVKSTPQLQNCDPKTTISAAMTAATLKLPINPNLGFAYIVPYKTDATFQIGYKGIIQLAMRTGQYKTINASVVHEGEVEDVDFITGEIIRGKRKSNEIIGYIAYFKLVNGFEKTLYMTKEDMELHASQFSQSYNTDKRYSKSRSVWSTNFDAMALKTVLKQLISKYGIMSIDMQGGEAMATAMANDQAVIGEDGTPTYIDNQPQEVNVTPEEPQDFPEEPQQAAPSPAKTAEEVKPQQEAKKETSEAPALEFDAGEPEF